MFLDLTDVEIGKLIAICYDYSEVTYAIGGIFNIDGCEYILLVDVEQLVYDDVEIEVEILKVVGENEVEFVDDDKEIDMVIDVVEEYTLIV